MLLIVRGRPFGSPPLTVQKPVVTRQTAAFTTDVHRSAREAEAKNKDVASDVCRGGPPQINGCVQNNGGIIKQSGGETTVGGRPSASPW